MTLFVSLSLHGVFLVSLTHSARIYPCIRASMDTLECPVRLPMRLLESCTPFRSRGMSPCLFVALMWTHTTVDMASLCPLHRLTCTTSAADVDAFTDKSRLYFKAGDNLDYFKFFLTRGTYMADPITKVNTHTHPATNPLSHTTAMQALNNVAYDLSLFRLLYTYIHTYLFQFQYIYRFG